MNLSNFFKTINRTGKGKLINFLAFNKSVPRPVQFQGSAPIATHNPKNTRKKISKTDVWNPSGCRLLGENSRARSLTNKSWPKWEPNWKQFSKTDAWCYFTNLLQLKWAEQGVKGHWSFSGFHCCSHFVCYHCTCIVWPWLRSVLFALIVWHIAQVLSL